MMYVTDWAFSTYSNLDKVTMMQYPHLNIPDAPYSETAFVAQNYYHFLHSDVLDVIGIAGQATANPASIFAWHAVVWVGDMLFDPSYGVTYGTGGAGGNAMLAEIDGAMAGHSLFFRHGGFNVNELWVGVDLNNDDLIEDRFVDTITFIVQPNPSGNQLRHRPGSPENYSR